MIIRLPAYGALICLWLSLLSGCASSPLPPVAVKLPSRPVSYQSEVRPLLEKRCTVCHSCYNSPCQLKLDSFEGLDRGATKEAVYNATRLKSMEPTRLFVDAQNTADWRKRSFFSVTSNDAGQGFNNSILLQLLDHKRKHPDNHGEFRPEADDLTCAHDRDEVSGYLRKHPNRGMPYGFPPLRQEEFETIAGWLAQGAKGPSPAEQSALERPAAVDSVSIARWEEFLNRDDAKHAMTARYLYEHLFLAHISFGAGSTVFFELVRSKTAPGKPIDLIATVRPYDSPGNGPMYYRFRKIHSTIVNKTHMVFICDEAQLARIKELFIQPAWLQTPCRGDYDPKTSANPFQSFEQIPPRSRYQFLLDNAHYIIMTFIHGPVCKGQVALNVINDHFWVMFMDPEYDLSIRYPGFLRFHGEQLRLPTESGSDRRMFSALLDDHRSRALSYYRSRQDYYSTHYYDGLGYDSIWKGTRNTDSPLLTVYRHFDSASVHRGTLGSLPKTLWVIDYPLLERIYYALVAGFDIYGTMGHQLAVRQYMDILRLEGESYFIDLLPSDSRNSIMQSWYGSVDMSKTGYYPSPLPAGIHFSTRDPKRELVENLVDHHLPAHLGISFDRINYLRSDDVYPPVPEKLVSREDYMLAFRALSRPGMPFATLVNDHNANLAYMRIRMKQSRDLAISLVVNRWHDNVAFMFGEDGRLDPARDRIEFLPGLIGSYPNYFFDVSLDDLPDFLDLLATFNRSPEHLARMAKYGINRSDERFWDTYDWFQKRFDQDQPLHGGLLDLNRYFYKGN